MSYYKPTIVVALLCGMNGNYHVNVGAFTISPKIHAPIVSSTSHYTSGHKNFAAKRLTTPTILQMSTGKDQEDEDDEIERLRAMAAKLRAEAATLEADKAQQMAVAAEKAFKQFDTNQDGEISLAELKAGLEKVLKTELSDQRVKDLMEEFDASGDGALQLDEFVGVDRFRNKLEEFSREEKRMASEAKQMALREQEVAQLLEAKAAILNDKAPTNQDKFLSILPYLFPLMDGLQYGRFLLGAEGAEANPFVVILALLYALYRSVPFSGFIAFFVLNILGGNPSINRLIRYNMQQAIFLDIALFFPGLLSGLIGLTAGSAGFQFPAIVTQLSTDAIFVTLLAVLGYCTASSLLGITPNKIPLISPAVDDRMPTVDMFDIDAEGRITPRPREDEDRKDDKKN